MKTISTISFDSLPDDFKGKYYSLMNMTKDEQIELAKDGLLFQKPQCPVLASAGMARDWPDARGIWQNENKTFLARVNEEDHTQFISTGKSGDVKAVFKRFCDGLKKVEKNLKQAGKGFMWSQHLGYITTCPSNLGTGLEASLTVKLPLLSKVIACNYLVFQLYICCTISVFLAN